MSGRRLFVACVLVTALGGTGPARAQEDLNRGKTPAQLFVSDCADCHRSPRGLAKMDGRSLADFLRVHYTASKENAAAIATYLVSLAGETPPASARSPRSAPTTAAKPGEPDKNSQSKPAAPASGSNEPAASKPSEPAAKPADTGAAKPSEPAKPAEAKPSTEAKPPEAKPTEAKPAETKPAEAKPAETKPAEAKPAEAKPAEAKPPPPASEPKPAAPPSANP